MILENRTEQSKAVGRSRGCGWGSQRAAGERSTGDGGEGDDAVGDGLVAAGVVEPWRWSPRNTTTSPVALERAAVAGLHGHELGDACLIFREVTGR